MTGVQTCALPILRPLGVTSLKRAAALPDVPTISEAGLKGYEISTWYGIALPANAPKAVVERIHADTVSVLAQKDVIAVLDSLGAEAVGNTPAEFARMIRDGIPVWVKLVKSMRTRG